MEYGEREPLSSMYRILLQKIQKRKSCDKIVRYCRKCLFDLLQVRPILSWFQISPIFIESISYLIMRALVKIIEVTAISAMLSPVAPLSLKVNVN